jgi:DNA uptake protein ComE-like DNA-binding protein
VDNENRSRVYLLAEENKLREALGKVFEDDPEVVELIITAVRASKGDTNNIPPNNNPANNPNPPGSNNPPAGENNPENNTPNENSPPSENSNPENENNSNNPPDENQVSTTTRKLDSPASLMRVRSPEGELVPSPIAMEYLPMLMDRLTVINPSQKQIDGLINVNTAPLQVLQCLPGITEEEVALIIDVRNGLGVEEMKTTAWLVMNEAVSMDTFERIAPLITARGQQFMIESLGYADHIGMVTRLQVIVDMVGPIIETIYYRDLTRLGGQSPIREQDRENIRVR